jgi:cholesterol oxidase
LNTARQWIARNISCLFDEVISEASPSDIDVLIVGSGYGASIAAAHLSQQALSRGDGQAEGRQPRVVMIERGQEYLPGSFPSTFAELAGHVRISQAGKSQPKGNLSGLFDIRMGPDVNVLVGNGVGGGSLINAGVMLTPSDEVLNSAYWPDEIRNSVSGLNKSLFQSVRSKLGANTLDSEGNELWNSSSIGLNKQLGLKNLGAPAKGSYKAVPIQVALTDQIHDGVKLNACLNCGDCASGCNYNAKKSFDVTLLASAQRRGVEIYQGGFVHSIQRVDESWVVKVGFTDAALRDENGLQSIKAKHVILAAGTLGSTEILMRSTTVSKSARIGKQFSSNGDMIAALHGQRSIINAIADESKEPALRNVGPTITGMIDLRGDNRRHNTPLMIQEMAVPGALRHIFEEVVTTANALQTLSSFDSSTHESKSAKIDPAAVNPTMMSHTSVIALMGNDFEKLGESEKSLIVLPNDSLSENKLTEGNAFISWPGHKNSQLFDTQFKVLQELATESGEGGAVVPNPVWKFLPDSFSGLIPGGAKGASLTVHPLGGCCMGKSANTGVVNHLGQVFNSTNGESVYESLCVLDGAIIPAPLGVNPGLTIATVAERAIKLLAKQWGMFDSASSSPLEEVVRPWFKTPAELRQEFFSDDKKETQVEVLERLVGTVKLKNSRNEVKDYVVELSLRFEAAALNGLMSNSQRTLSIGANPTLNDRYLPAPSISQLRVFDAEEWLALTKRRGDKDGRASQIKLADENSLDEIALVKVPVAGSMQFFHFENSGIVERIFRSITAWLQNRGGRDLTQKAFEFFTEVTKHPTKLLSLLPLKIFSTKSDNESNSAGFGIGAALKLASHAGAVRLFDYVLKTTSATLSVKGKEEFSESMFSNASMLASKRFTYNRYANPWRQLTELQLTEFPRLVSQSPEDSILSLDLKYLAHQNTPLMRIVQEENQPSSLMDLGRFSLYLLRVLVFTHLWSFRKPDDWPETPKPNRLPMQLQGLSLERYGRDRIDGKAFSEVEITPLLANSATDVLTKKTLLLTRYKANEVTPKGPPVVMIHGYSASGTTFAHHALPHSAVGMLCKKGRDVWVLDVRSSAGLETAKDRWTYEQIAKEDLTQAFDFVLKHANVERLDVVAQCIGAAMFSMVVLDEDEHSEFSKKIRCAVMFHKAPVLKYAQSNILRSYIWRYVREYLGDVSYSFFDDKNNGAGYAVLDRLIATMPYSDEEYLIENPTNLTEITPYIKTRHRLDLLYGRTFSLRNLHQDVRNHINDFFGPLNLDTVTQTLHFAQRDVIADSDGNNEYVSVQKLSKKWTFPTYLLGAEENGLADPSTLTLVDLIMGKQGYAGLDVRTECLPNVGHQDMLIGNTANLTFDKVGAFLEEMDSRALVADVNLPQGEVGASDAKAWTRRLKPCFPATGPRVIVDPAVPLFTKVLFGLEQGKETMDYWAVVPIHFESNSDLPVLGPKETILWPEVPEPTLRDYAASWAALKAQAKKTLGQFNATHFVFVLLTPDPELLGRQMDQRAPADGEIVTWDTYQPHKKIDDLDVDSVFLKLTEFISKAEISVLLSACIPADNATELLDWKPSNSLVPDKLTLIVGSCQYPAGMLDAGPAYASMRKLSAQLSNTPRAQWPDVAIWCGDQVYLDALAGVFDPTVKQNRVDKPYQNWLRSRAVQSVLSKLPSLMVMDDHEIRDNWHPKELDDTAIVFDETGESQDDIQAISGFRVRQRGQDRFGGVIAQQNGIFHENRELAIRGFPLFVADTRFHRSPRSVKNLASAKLLHEEDIDLLTGWFSRIEKSVPAFIVSPSIFLPRSKVQFENLPSSNSKSVVSLLSDSWSGFPISRDDVIRLIWNHAPQNLVFLSGDEHFPCDATITLSQDGTDKKVIFRSIHSSALHAPFPFANGQRADLKLMDSLKILDDSLGGTAIDCTISTKVFPEFQSGYCVVSVRQKFGRWDVDANMVNAHGFDAYRDNAGKLGDK